MLTDNVQHIGNMSLLEVRKIGFLASRKIASHSVLPVLDWGFATAKRENVTVVSGFQSQLERKVFETLVKGRCGIALVLNRSIYKKVPMELQPLVDAGRLVILSLVPGNVTRGGQYYSEKRNDFIVDISHELVFASVTEKSSLFKYLATDKLKIMF